MITINDDGTIILNSNEGSIIIYYISSSSQNDESDLYTKINSPNQINLIKMLHESNLPYIIRTNDYDYVVFQGKVVYEDDHIYPYDRIDFLNKYSTENNLNLFNLMDNI